MNESKFPGNEPEEKNLDTLKEDIRTSRERVGQDVEALAEKLSPDNLKREAKGAALHMKDEAVATAKEKAHDAADSAKEKVVETAEAVRETAHDAVEAVRDRAHDAADVMRYQAGVAADTLRTTGLQVSRGARAHAIPLTLIGGGLSWLAYDLFFASKRRERKLGTSDRGMRSLDYAEPSYPSGTTGMGTMDRPAYYGESFETSSSMAFGEASHDGENLQGRVREGATELKDRAREGAADLKGRFDEVRGEIGSRMHDVGSEVRGRMDRARAGAEHSAEAVTSRAKHLATNIRHQLDANPMGFALFSFAVGTGIGMLVPTTRREAEALGAARDRVMHTVRDKAEDVKEIASKSVRAAGDTARTEASQRGLTPRS